ncbi:VWA domain-containing protein [archaeon]|nr:MAG: VWA domain-containing protein [archaeon]
MQEALLSLGVLSTTNLLLLWENYEIQNHVKTQVSEEEYSQFLSALRETSDVKMSSSADSEQSASDESKSSSPVLSEEDFDIDHPIGDFALSSKLSFRCISASPLSISPYSPGLSILHSEVHTANHLLNLLIEGHELVTQEPDLHSKTQADLYRIALPLTALSTNPIMKASVQSTESIDICFVVDCSGSMGCFLDSIVRNIDSFVESIRKRQNRLATLRLAFVGYRDFCDDVRIVLQHFTESVSGFKSIVARQKAYGGGDDAEDVIGALQTASKLSWRSATRILYLVGDSPCHGSDFHDSNISDFHPQGDPYGYQVEDILKKLRSDNVQMFFGKIDGKRTDMMIQMFNELAGKPAPYIFELSVIAKSVVHMLSAKLDGMLLSSVSQQNSTQQLALPAEQTTKVKKNQEQVIRYSMARPLNSLEHLLCPVKKFSTEDFPDTEIYEVQVDSVPLLKGDRFDIYRGIFAEKGELGQMTTPNVVLRAVSKRTKTKSISKAHYDSIISCYRAAKYLAEEFNKIRPVDSPSIHYVDAHIIQMCERWPEQPYMICEDYIPGQFKSYNSSHGEANSIPSPIGTDLDVIQVQAFSHWTHHATSGNLMVLGCQGVFEADNNRLMLTAPVIHCVDATRFGQTNLGKQAMEEFLGSHRCNWCVLQSNEAC